MNTVWRHTSGACEAKTRIPVDREPTGATSTSRSRRPIYLHWSYYMVVLNANENSLDSLRVLTAFVYWKNGAVPLLQHPFPARFTRRPRSPHRLYTSEYAPMNYWQGIFSISMLWTSFSPKEVVDHHRFVWMQKREREKKKKKCRLQEIDWNQHGRMCVVTWK